jgi:hypothetical protein
MASLTAIELGTDICALARTSVRGGDVHLLAAETLDPAAFPGVDSFTAALRQTRRRQHMPRRCRAVVWGLPDGASRKDPTIKSLLAPMVGAGFRIERVISPCNALAALARLKTPRGAGATCWLAINRGGVAMVAVRPGQQLYAHAFAWDSSVGASGSQARLLQRYSLVSFLAPEIRRAMAAAREKGAPVVAIVTCGNLPDLRSLTMPLIEELDVEVETLDSLEGLAVKPQQADRLADLAPAIRVACAGAIGRGTRRWDESKRHKSGRLSPVAVLAAVVLVALGAWVVYAKAFAPAPRTVSPAVNRQPPVPKTAPPITKTESPVVKRETPPPPAPTQTPVVPAPKPIVPAPKPVVTTPPPPPVRQIPPVLPPIQRAPKAAAPPLTRPVPTADKPEAARPVPLKDPVPRVTGILVSNERRLATIEGGRIVGVGDAIGNRVVAAIDQDTVLLREPSGVQIRVGLGGKVIGIERRDR